MKKQTVDSRRVDSRARVSLVVVRKSAVRAMACELREGTTGRVVAMPAPVLTRVWAVAEKDGDSAIDRARACEPLRQDGVVDPQVGVHRANVTVEGELAFYRKYTEGVLRRYLWLSMAGGRVASLLGRELFRGAISNYSVQNFEDVSIFCVDVEKCLNRLTPMERALLKRIAVQQYSQGEAAVGLRISLRSCVRRYHQAVDKLTGIFLATRMLEPLKSCQGGKEGVILVRE
jgi:hypothetical protein